MIERLFARFAAVYGVKFAQAWAGADPEEMKRVWSERLSRFEFGQISDALAICETEVKYPPTLPQFIEMVRQCFKPAGLGIEYKQYPAPPQRSDAELIAVREYPKPKNGFGTFWAKQIVRMAQLNAYDSCAGLLAAMKVLGLENIDQLAAKYPPYVDPERAALQSEGV